MLPHLAGGIGVTTHGRGELMKRCWFQIDEPPMRRIELTDEEDGRGLTLVAWQRQHGRFAPVKLDRAEAKRMRDALASWLRSATA